MTFEKVLSGAVLMLLLAVILSSPQVRADGMHGVRETATEILVEVPKFCRPVKFVWEARWEQNADNEDAMLSFTQGDKNAKIVVDDLRHGVLKLHIMWKGGQIVRIPKFDAKGKPIKIKRLSIAGMGDEFGDLSQDNWIFILSGVRATTISPPVRVGTWGKCS